MHFENENLDSIKEDKEFEITMLRNNKDMPKIQIIDDEKSIEMYGGERMYFARY